MAIQGMEEILIEKKTDYLYKRLTDKLHVFQLSSLFASEFDPLHGAKWPICIHSGNISLSVSQKEKKEMDGGKLNNYLSNCYQTRRELHKGNTITLKFGLVNVMAVIHFSLLNCFNDQLFNTFETC